MPRRRNRRDAAAAELLACATRSEAQPDRTIALCWPANLGADPEHTWIAANAVHALDTQHRRQQWLLVEPLLAQRGEDHCWPAAGAFDRSTRTAMLCSAIALLYCPE